MIYVICLSFILFFFALPGPSFRSNTNVTLDILVRVRGVGFEVKKAFKCELWSLNVMRCILHTVCLIYLTSLLCHKHKHYWNMATENIWFFNIFDRSSTLSWIIQFQYKSTRHWSSFTNQVRRSRNLNYFRSSVWLYYELFIIWDIHKTYVFISSSKLLYISCLRFGIAICTKTT